MLDEFLSSDHDYPELLEAIDGLIVDSIGQDNMQIVKEKMADMHRVFYKYFEERSKVNENIRYCFFFLLKLYILSLETSRSHLDLVTGKHIYPVYPYH